MSDYIHVDDAVNTVLEEEWLSAEDIIGYIEERSQHDVKFFLEIRKLLKKINWKELEIKCLMKKFKET